MHSQIIKKDHYNAPEKIYPENPYDNTIFIIFLCIYFNILNIDTYSLSARKHQGEYYGWVQTGMTLKGETSGAEATITDVRLISDLGADIIGSFYIPNPNNIDYPRFETGTKVFTLVNDEDNNQDDATTIAEEPYTSSRNILKQFKKILFLLEMQELNKTRIPRKKCK